MKRVLLRTLCWGGLLVVALLTVNAVWRGVLALKFERRLDEIRARGEPALSVEMARPQPPDADNAAPLLMRAHAWYAENAKGQPAVVSEIPAEEWSESQWQEVRRWVDRCAPYVEMVQEAVKRPACWQDLDWESDIYMKVPLVFVAGEAARVFRLRALCDAREQGGSASAAERIAALIKLGSLLERHVSRWFIGTIAQVPAIQVLQEIARGSWFDAPLVRAKLEPVLRDAERPGAVREVLLGERAMWTQVVSHWIAGTSPREYHRVGEPSWFEGSWLARPLAYRDGLRLLDLMDEALVLSERPYSEAIVGLKGLVADAERLHPSYFHTKLISGRPYMFYKRAHKHRARMRLARIVLALLEYRQETGSWPDTLDALKREFDGPVPVDPFTGNPFHYENKDAKVRLEAAAPIPSGVTGQNPEFAWELLSTRSEGWRQRRRDRSQ